MGDRQGWEMVAYPGRLLAGAAAVGIAFDVLFWGKPAGVNVALFVLGFTVWLVVGAVREGLRPAGTTVAVGVGLSVLAAGAAVRADPATVALDVLAASGLLALLVHTLPDGAWTRYGVRDTVRNAWRLGVGVLASGGRTVAAAGAALPRAGTPARRHAGPVVRGTVLAVPVVTFFGVLLGSADPVFAARLGSALSWIQPVALDDTAARAAVAAVVAFLAAGAAAHAVARVHPVPSGPLPFAPPLGPVETGIVLGAVEALFAAFVAVQVRYLFGAPATVLGGTTTFADYARRGFAELVVVAAASLLLLLGLAGLSRRSSPVARRTFAGLAAGLTGLVLVILASAFRRLLLYEAAFGFTRARVWAHLFMVVLGLLLAALLAAVVTDRLRWFLQATGAAVLVFALALTAINVDALVAARNVERASAGAELDGAYLAGLSSDAVPALVAAEARAEPALRASLSAVIACHAEPLRGDRPWQSANLSRWRARRALATRPAGPDGCPFEARPYP